MESLFNKSGKDLEKSKISSNYVPRFKTIADIKIKALFHMDEIEQVTRCTASHNGVPQVLDFIRRFYFIFY